MAPAPWASLFLALAALAAQAPLAAATPSDAASLDGALAPEAFAEDDACGAEGDGEGTCSVSLRQLRGEARAAGQALASEAGGEGEAQAAGQALASQTSEAGEAAKALDEAAEQQGQVPSWWWHYYHPPSYNPSYYRPPTYSPPSYVPSYNTHLTGPASETTIYMYRAKGPKNFEDTSVNMANLPGVMWYLHNEVVRACPRKFGITRVLRYKITMKATPELFTAMHQGHFAHLCHFDSGKCTGPGNSLADYSRYGYAVGCDKPSQHVASYKQATWFSMPGVCPRLTFKQKGYNPACRYQDPGGECKAGEAWSKSCTWRKEYAGEVSLTELTGVNADHSWCHKGNYEWKSQCDCGHGTSFWNGKTNSAKNTERMAKLRDLFKKKYPDKPADLGEAHCPFGDHNR